MTATALRRRRAIRWARYFNHYSAIDGVSAGSWSAVRAMSAAPGRTWREVRRQAKRKFVAAP